MQVYTDKEVLADGLCAQKGVFNMMHQRGFYETPAADEMKVQQAKQKFSQGFQQV